MKIFNFLSLLAIAYSAKPTDQYKDNPVLRGAKPTDQYKDSPVIRSAKPTDQYKDNPVVRSSSLNTYEFGGGCYVSSIQGNLLTYNFTDDSEVCITGQLYGTDNSCPCVDYEKKYNKFYYYSKCADNLIYLMGMESINLEWEPEHDIIYGYSDNQTSVKRVFDRCFDPFK